MALFSKEPPKEKLFKLVRMASKGWTLRTDGTYTERIMPYTMDDTFLRQTRNPPVQELLWRENEVGYMKLKEEIFQGKPVYLLEYHIATSDGTEYGVWYCYYDKTTLFKIGHRLGSTMGIVTVYDDFQEVKGFWYPRKETVINGLNQTVRVITSFTIDENVDAYFAEIPMSERKTGN